MEDGETLNKCTTGPFGKKCGALVVNSSVSMLLTEYTCMSRHPSPQHSGNAVNPFQSPHKNANKALEEQDSIL